jgi:RNAse (barnase) inhibitor barstar
MVEIFDFHYSFRLEEQVVEDLAELWRQLTNVTHRPSPLKWVII